MKYLKTYEQLNESVKVGELVKLVNDNDAPGTYYETQELGDEDLDLDAYAQHCYSKVQKVYPDGRILTDDRGHGVIAKFSKSYDAWLVDEDCEEGDKW